MDIRDLPDLNNILLRRDPVLTATEAQTVTMRGLLSGDATFSALNQAVEALSNAAPKDHDVLIHAFNISVTHVRYIEPHTFIFEGFDSENHPAFVTFHFSQLVAHVIYIPKRGPKRVITGFAHSRVGS